MPTTTQKEMRENTDLLIQASRLGDVNKVKRLIPVSDPKASNSLALRRAVINGYTDIVKLLIPVSDPTAENSLALQNAAIFGYADIIKLLIPVSDYQLVLQQNIGEINLVLLQQCVEEYEVLQQKDRLNNTLAETVETKNDLVKRKM